MNDGQWDPRCERPSGLVVPASVDPRGVIGPTRGQAAGPYFRQTSPGRYVPIEVDDRIPEQRILEQGTRILRTGAVTAWASLRWHGARFFDGAAYDGTRLPVPIVGDKLRPDPRITASQEQLAPTEWCVIEGLACTTVQRALFDEIRRHRSWREAVVAAEMTVAAGLISVRLMTDYIAQRAAWAGVPFARKVIALAVEGLRSPQESRMRLVWIFDAGLDPPLCNRPIFDLGGRLLGVPDLFDPVAGLVGEYDGAAHKDGRRHQRDVAREELFRDHGLEYFEIVGGDLRDRRLCAHRMLSARSRAKFLPPESCAWTLNRPAWYPEAESLDAMFLRTGRAESLRST